MNQKQEVMFDKIVDFCQRKYKKAGNDISKLSFPEQVVLAIYSAQGVIDNGGFQYFFESDFPNKPDYAVFIRAYAEIGAVREAEILETAVSMFGFPDPHLHIEKRRYFLDQLDEEAAFFKVEDELCGNGDIWKKLTKYACQHIEIK